MTDFKKRYIDFCKPFVDAVKGVYSTMLHAEVEAGAPKIKGGNLCFGTYSSIMGINGSFDNGSIKKNFKGAMVLSWPRETYLKSASAMLMEEYTEINAEIADVGMEIANMTMGNAKKVLVHDGFSIEMSIPTCVKGDGHEITVQKGIVTIVTPLSCVHGEFHLELNYEDFDVE